jgi:hypothetical protein
MAGWRKTCSFRRTLLWQPNCFLPHHLVAAWRLGRGREIRPAMEEKHYDREWE